MDHSNNHNNDSNAGGSGGALSSVNLRDDEVIVEVPLQLVAREIGATYGVELWVADELVFAKRAGTRHADRAVAAGVEMIAEMLRGAAEQHLSEHYDYDPGDPHGDIGL